MAAVCPAVGDRLLEWAQLLDLPMAAVYSAVRDCNCCNGLHYWAMIIAWVVSNFAGRSCCNCFLCCVPAAEAVGAALLRLPRDCKPD